MAFWFETSGLLLVRVSPELLPVWLTGSFPSCSSHPSSHKNTTKHPKIQLFSLVKAAASQNSTIHMSGRAAVWGEAALLPTKHCASRWFQKALQQPYHQMQLSPPQEHRCGCIKAKGTECSQVFGIYLSQSVFVPTPQSCWRGEWSAAGWGAEWVGKEV